MQRKLYILLTISFLSVTLYGCDNTAQSALSEEDTGVYIVSGGDVSSSDIYVSDALSAGDLIASDVSGSDVSLNDSEISVKVDEDNLKEEQKIVAEEPYPFTFRDVYGKEYETTISPGFPKHPYVIENFIKDNGLMSYEDDKYIAVRGIDVSNKQHEIDWEKVKASGIEFVIIRLGFRGYGEAGDIHIDQSFKRNMEGAAANGIPIGVYFFAQAINEEEALEEADFVIENLEGYDISLPVVYDPESILKDTARTDNVSGEQFTKNAIAFCEAIKAAGYEPMIYSNMLWEAFEFEMDKLTDYRFWYADYEDIPQTPYFFEFWQYSERGHIDGIKNAVDYDIWIKEK